MKAEHGKVWTILERNSGESIRIGDDLVIHLDKVLRCKVIFRIDAPPTVSVITDRIAEEIQRIANAQADNLPRP